MEMDGKSAEGMRAQLLMQLEMEHAGMRAAVEHVPEDKLGYKPHEKLKGFAELAMHIYDTGSWFASIVESGKANFEAAGNTSETPASKPALLQKLDAMYEATTKTVGAASPEVMATLVPFANFGSFPAISYLGWHISHLIHHRGQLTVYLRMMDAKVPAIYGDSADYPMEMG